jgi:hypothetical protein
MCNKSIICGMLFASASSLAKGYDPLYSSSPLASLDGFEDLTRLILLFNGKLVLLFQTYNIILYVHPFLFCWHFSYRTYAFCKARSDWLQLSLAAWISFKTGSELRCSGRVAIPAPYVISWSVALFGGRTFTGPAIVDRIC